MTDQPPESRPAPPPEPDPTHTSVLPPDQEPPEPRQRLQDRLWSFRSVIAVALASVIVGGLGGAALASVAQDDDERRFGPGQGRFNRGDPDGPSGMMDDRRRERMKQWRDERGLGQRQRGQDGPPGVPPSGLPTPIRPTPTA